MWPTLAMRRFSPALDQAQFSFTFGLLPSMTEISQRAQETLQSSNSTSAGTSTKKGQENPQHRHPKVQLSVHAPSYLHDRTTLETRLQLEQGQGGSLVEKRTVWLFLFPRTARL